MHVFPQTDCTEGDVRLINGTFQFEGIIQVCYDGEWGTVCDDDWYFTFSNNTKVVCQQLGQQLGEPIAGE